MDKLEKAFELIQENFLAEEIFGNCGINTYLIDEVEKMLNILLPSSYKKFLKNFGYGGVKSFMVTGIRSKNSEELAKEGVVWSVINDRKNFSVPNYIICIEELGDGSYYALDLSQMNKDNECPIVIWPIDGYDSTPKLEIVAPDFATWFLDMVKQQIEFKRANN